MTKDAYFEMCETLGSEPLDSEIPVELEDFYPEVQEALMIYHKLRDEWDYMNGNYLGKKTEGLIELLKILDVPLEDHRTMFDLVYMIDKHRSKAIADKKPKQSK